MINPLFLWAIAAVSICAEGRVSFDAPFRSNSGEFLQLGGQAHGARAGGTTTGGVGCIRTYQKNVCYSYIYIDMYVL